MSFEPERRKGHQELVEKFDTHASQVENKLERRLERFIKKALVGFAVIGFFTAIALFGFGLVLREQGESNQKVAALAKANADLVEDIQSQRATNIREDCESLNSRHDKTTAALIKGAKQDEDRRVSGVEKKEVRRRRDVTLGLIDALVPKENCNKKVRDALGQK